MRKWLYLFLAVVVVFASSVFTFCVENMPSVHAQHGSSGSYSNVWSTHDYEAVTSTTGVVKTITSGLINTSGLQKTNRAYILVVGQAIRFRCDGGVPSTSVGNPLPANQWFQVVGLSDIQNFQFINDDDTGSAICHINLQYEEEMNHE